MQIILYIEDEIPVGMEAKMMAEAEFDGIGVILASNYQQAKEALFKTWPQIDMIVSDFSFEGKDGISKTGGVEFYKYAMQECQLVPFYFLSGTDGPGINAVLREHKIFDDVARYCHDKNSNKLSDVIRVAMGEGALCCAPRNPQQQKSELAPQAA